VWPFFGAIALFVMLVLLWLGERLADSDRRRQSSSKRRLPPGSRRS
jgi:hypothetical protein